MYYAWNHKRTTHCSAINTVEFYRLKKKWASKDGLINQDWLASKGPRLKEELLTSLLLGPGALGSTYLLAKHSCHVIPGSSNDLCPSFKYVQTLRRNKQAIMWNTCPLRYSNSPFSSFPAANHTEIISKLISPQTYSWKKACVSSVRHIFPPCSRARFKICYWEGTLWKLSLNLLRP